MQDQPPLGLESFDQYDPTHEISRLHGCYYSLVVPQSSCCGGQEAPGESLVTFDEINEGHLPPAIATSERLTSVFHKTESCLRSTIARLQSEGEKDVTLTMVSWEPTVPEVLEKCWRCGTVSFRTDLTDLRLKRNVVAFTSNPPPQNLNDLGESYTGCLTERYKRPLTDTQIASGIVNILPQDIPRALPLGSKIVVDSNDPCLEHCVSHGSHQEYWEDWEDYRNKQQDEREKRAADTRSLPPARRQMPRTDVKVRFREASSNAPRLHLDLSLNIDTLLSACKTWVSNEPPPTSSSRAVNVRG